MLACLAPRPRLNQVLPHVKKQCEDVTSSMAHPSPVEVRLCMYVNRICQDDLATTCGGGLLVQDSYPSYLALTLPLRSVSYITFYFLESTVKRNAIFCLLPPLSFLVNHFNVILVNGNLIFYDMAILKDKYALLGTCVVQRSQTPFPRLPKICVV